MTPELLALAFGGLSALSWGSGDFNGGLATKRLGVLHVLTVVHGVGLVLTLVLGLLSGQAIPPTGELALAAGAGVIGLVSLGALYRGLAEGQMGIAAPVSSVLSAALPLVYSVALGGTQPDTPQMIGFGFPLVYSVALGSTQPDTVQMIGFGVALVAIVLISLASGKIEGGSGLSMAVVAGVGFGVYFILMSFIESESVFWLAAVSRAVTFALLLMVVRRQGTSLYPPNRLTGVLLLLAGVLDVFGNIFFLLSAQSGRLDIAAVVVALYPAVTIVLAAGLLKERMSRLQILGVLLALGAVALIAA